MRSSMFCWFITILVLLGIIALYCTGCSWIFHKELPPVQIQPTITNTIIKQVKVNDWLVTGSILLMGVGVFGFFNGWKQGVALIAAAGAVLGISLILKAYGAILVFAGAVCIAGIVGWQIYIRVRGLHEVVKGLENVKAVARTMPVSEGDILTQLNEQSPATKKLVDSIQRKINGVVK